MIYSLLQENSEDRHVPKINEAPMNPQEKLVPPPYSSSNDNSKYVLPNEDGQ